MPKVLTVYCIGSAHNYKENYNTLVSLCDSTNAGAKILITHAGNRTNYIGVQTIDREEPLNPGWENQNQICVLIDGPNFDKGMPATEKSGEYINNQTDKLCVIASKYSPDIVNLVGHSRGAIMCNVFAWKLSDSMDYKYHDKNYFGLSYTGTTNPIVNVFLIDPVNHTDISIKFALGLSPVTNGYKRIIMEDAGGVTGAVSTNSTDNYAFPLEKITDESSHYKIQTLDNIRIPGTHGTASQLTPVANNGEKLPNPAPVTINTPSKSKDFFPIARIAFCTVMNQLSIWETNYDTLELIFSSDTRNIINEYARVFNINKFLLNRNSHNRLVNNAPRSEPNQTISYSWVKPSRDKNQLNLICPNPYRWGIFFINQQHAALFKDKYKSFYDVLPEDLSGSYEKVLNKPLTQGINTTKLQAIRIAFIRRVSNLATGDLGDFLNDLRNMELFSPQMYEQICLTLKIDKTTIDQWKQRKNS